MPSLENQHDYTPEAPRQSAELSREVMSFAPVLQDDFLKINAIGAEKTDNKLSNTTDSAMQVAPIWASVWKGNASEQDQLDQGRMKDPYQNFLAQQLEAQWKPNKSLEQNFKISAPGAQRSELASQRADISGQRPDAVAQRSDASVPRLSGTGQLPDFAGPRPDITGRRPDLATQRPEAVAQQTELSGQRPDLSARRTDAATQRGLVAQRPDGETETPGQRQTEGDRTTPRPEGERIPPRNEAGSRIAAASEGMMDQRVWRGTKHERSVHQGRLGGAASVSRILQGEGYRYADSANVGKLTDQLASHGWQRVGREQLQPGDVIFGGRQGTNWRAGGGNARVGIVGPDGMIHYNNPETGKWTKSSPEEAFQRGHFGNNVWALRPPEGGPDAGPQRAGPDAQRMRGRRDQGREFPTSDEGRRQRHEDGAEGERRQRRRRGRREDGERHNRRRSRESDHRQPDSDDSQPVRDRTRSLSGPRGEQNAANLRSAKEHVGDQLWRNGYGLRNGRLGCAASVSEVLRDAGVRGVRSAGVAQAAEQLTRQGWTQHSGLDKAEPGDVVVVVRRSGWRNGGGGAHIGIVGEDGKVYHNKSKTGRWIEDSLQRTFGGGMSRFILKPPRGR